MKKTLRVSAALSALLLPSLVHAHHVMDKAMPATLAQGLLSGLGHPVIGLDHLAFIVAAGVLAARYPRGVLLAVLFVLASSVGAAVHVAGFDLPAAQWLIAATLLAIAVPMIRRGADYLPVVAALYAVAGCVHGYALAESIVGAEPTPLAGYFAGLIAIQAVLAIAAYAAARWCARRRPAFPIVQSTGVAAGVVGIALIALGVA